MGQRIHKLGDEWERVLIFYSDGIEFAVILDRSEGTILFANEEEWGSDRRFARLDAPSLEMFVDELFQGFAMFWA